MDFFNATIDFNDYDTGIFRISLVKYPATETAWQTYSKDKSEQLKFSVVNPEKRIVTGVIMLADTPIYRKKGDYEFYVVYSRETLEQIAQKMLYVNTQNNLNTNHQADTTVPGMFCRELFIKDTEKGLNPKGFEETPEGSLFATYYVDSQEIWDRIKSGEFEGFSLEGRMYLEEITNDDESEEQEVMALLEKLSNKLKNK